MESTTRSIAMRNSVGSSLIELLIAVVIMGFVGTAVFGLLTTTMAAQQKLQNKCDSIDAAKQSIDRITKIVRMGRVLDPASNNMNLIVQCPKFSDTGYPYSDPTIGDVFETHTFRILPDPETPGEYMLTWRKDSGVDVPPSAADPFINADQGPSVLLKGIIGPNWGAGPQVFQFVDRTNPDTPQNVIMGSASNYTGVIANLEIIKHNASAAIGQNYPKSSSFAYKTEVFMRNNNSITQ